MKSYKKHISILTLCSTFVLGISTIPSHSYAETKLAISQNDEQLLQQFKQQLTAHLNNRETKIVLPYNTQSSNIQEILNQLINSYREILKENDYLRNTVGNANFSIRGLPGSYTLTLTMNYLESKEQAQYVAEQAEQIINSIITINMDDHEKVKAVHDYVVKLISYDTSLQAHTAYEALTNHSAVCQGYALLTYQLLKEAGLHVRIVEGTGNGQPHAWNLVEIEGKWYHLDTTFDDPVPDVQNRVTYSYFDLTDDQISGDHVWDHSQYPSATTNYAKELSQKINNGDPKATAYKKILQDAHLPYESQNQNNSIQKGWIQKNGKWYFFDSSGSMKTGWVQNGGKWYFLDSSGAMKTGWIQDNGKWYFLDSSGAMKTGWVQDGGKWYFLDSSGVMKTGWIQDNGKWYFLDSSGVMKIGWVQNGGKWYFFDSSGVMKTGWIQDNGKWYFLNQDGSWK
ncbi:transglutaminase domain-containing protein [Bacillus sp. FJAT-53711]|uniref:Transglutaminase domain-containing protein n=1 Tax=Bacillus yunxiaonensis TaxID=3127665 RepID=A0ABU8G149_9BACI